MAKQEIDSTMKLNNYWQKFRAKEEKPAYQYKETMELGQKSFVATLIFLGHSEEAQAIVKKDAARLAAAKMLEHFPADDIAATMSKQSPEQRMLKVSSSENSQPKASTNRPTPSPFNSPSKPKILTSISPNVPLPSASSSPTKSKPQPSTSSSSSSTSTPDDEPLTVKELVISDEARAERKYELERLLDVLLPQRQSEYAEYVQKFLIERDPYYDNLHANMKLDGSPKSALLRRILNENIDVNNISNIGPTFERIMKQMKTIFYCKFLEPSSFTTYVCVIRVAHNTLTFIEAGDTPQEAVQKTCREAVKSLVLFMRELN